MNLQGILPALVTPFDAAGEVDFSALEKLLGHLREAGVKGWVPNGSTGEYSALTADERFEILKFVADFANPDELLIAGGNGGSTREVIGHCERAREAGFDTVLLPAPHYALPAQDELITHYRAVMDAVDVKIVLYNYPSRVGVELGLEVLDALADHDRIIAIKESSGVVQRAIQIFDRYEGRLQLCNGSDDVALDFMMWGAQSWICGPANCMGAACVDLMNTYQNGDLSGARRRMAALFRAMNSLETGKFVQKVKYGCEIVGVPVGVCRAPLQPLNDVEKAGFRAALEPLLN